MGSLLTGMRIAFVLKTGGVYTHKHVRALHDQVRTYLREDAPVICLTDSEAVDRHIAVPLQHNWPGWWAKLEMFRPDIKGDLLYFDLDTVVQGSIDAFASVNTLTLLRDFYRDGSRRPEGLQSAVMYLPYADRAEVWDAFIANPKKAMLECSLGGDQQFLERFYLQRAQRWQDVLPGQVVSYKVHCKQGVPPDARVVCAHGKPKLWDTPEFKHLYE